MSKIGMSRWEAEEEDHRKHKEKMERVAERQKAKYEERKAVGTTCTMENCGRIFTDTLEFNEHVKQHKEDFKRRMICSQDKCGQKFNNRRAFNEHVEVHMQDMLKKTQKGIRSVLIPHKSGLLMEAFETEFRQLFGKFLPYRPLGYPTARMLLVDSPEVVEFVKLEDGQELLVAVPDEKTAHMARMVGNQMDCHKGYNYRTGEVLREQGISTWRTIDKVGGRKNRQIPGHMKRQAVELLQMEEYTGGLELYEFCTVYSNEFSYPLEFQSFGFFSIEDFLYNGLAGWVSLQLHGQNSWKVVPINSSEDKISSTDHLSTIVSQEVQVNMAVLMSTRPQGMELSAIPMIYSEYGDLDPRQFGFQDLLELCLFMPEICSVIKGERDTRVLPPPALSSRVSSVDIKTNTEVPSWVINNIKSVFVNNPTGVSIAEFCNKYLETVGDIIDVVKLGFSGLSVLLESLDGKVINVDFQGGKEVLTLHKSLKSLLWSSLGVDSLPSPQIEKNSSWVEVVHVVCPGKLWVQLEKARENVWELEDEMERFYSLNKQGEVISSERLVVGLVVAALYSDVCWHRAMITRVLKEQGKVELLYVDWGWRAQVDVGSICCLSKAFANLSQQGLLVKLSGLLPLDWEQDKAHGGVEELRGLLEGIQGVAWMQPREMKSALEVDLFIRRAGQMVLLNTLLVKYNLAKTKCDHIVGTYDKFLD